MVIIPQTYKILNMNGNNQVSFIEDCARVCYKSEDKKTKDSAYKLIHKLISNNHLSPLEHVSLSVRIITDRGVTHELVRHRLASYSQESTRYCNYGGGDVKFICPTWMELERCRCIANGSYASALTDPEWIFINACKYAECAYKDLLKRGWSPQQARSVLPNSLKTEIVMSCNLREWMHVFDLRCSKAAHPQIKALMLDMLKGFNEAVPVIFEDLAEKYLSGER